MEIFKSFWFRLFISLLGGLAIELAILFTIPPTTTPDYIFKDVLSLIICGLIYFKILKKSD